MMSALVMRAREREAIVDRERTLAMRLVSLALCPSYWRGRERRMKRKHNAEMPLRRTLQYAKREARKRERAKRAFILALDDFKRCRSTLVKCLLLPPPPLPPLEAAEAAVAYDE
jgi:hypothetical protein